VGERGRGGRRENDRSLIARNAAEVKPELKTNEHIYPGGRGRWRGRGRRQRRRAPPGDASPFVLSPSPPPPRPALPTAVTTV
jgi:hypothetical protein